MGKEKTIVCFEGVNNQIWKIPFRFNEQQMEIMREYCDRAYKYLQIDFFQKMLAGREADKLNNAYSELNLTYIGNCAALEYLLEKGIEPDAFVGYSLGVNSACVCSGAISFEDGLEINKLLFESMCYSYDHFNYGMSLIVGLTKPELDKIINFAGYDSSSVDIASVNSYYSFLLVGDGTALDRIGNYALEKGAILVNRIESYIPFHFNMREKWLTDNVDKFAEFNVHKMKYKVFSPYKFRYLHKNEITKELIINVYSKIAWKEAVQHIEEIGFKRFIDVSVTGSNKRISQLNLEDSKFYTLRNIEQLLVVD